jgi:hypothetical protein
MGKGYQSRIEGFHKLENGYCNGVPTQTYVRVYSESQLDEKLPQQPPNHKTVRNRAAWKPL